MQPLKDLLKHSGVYAIGQILSRVASVLLLPLYTHCLSTSDYGVVAILDLTAAVLSVMIGSGMAAAVTRYHFEGSSQKHYDQVWWTGLLYVAGASGFLILPMWLGREWLTHVTLGGALADGNLTLAQGSYFYALTLANCWCYCIGYIGDTYLRVLKRSGTFVLISLARLILNVGLNVYFLVGLEMGIEGLLIGNLISTVFQTLTLFVFFVATRGRPVFDMGLLRKLSRFGGPVILTGLLAMLMHEADRIIMQRLVHMDEVGVYSLAHKIGFAIETLCILPFASIWSVSLYEIAERPDAKQVYVAVFRYFVYGFGVLLLGAALAVHPVLPLLIDVSYIRSVDQIAVVLLGFFFFGLHFMFEVPALINKRTALLIPAAVAGVVVNVTANFVLVPHLGGFGAGWAGVLTYVVYSAVGLYCYRHLYPIDYGWRGPTLAVLGFCLTYVLLRYQLFPYLSPLAQLALAWSVVLLREPVLEYLRSRSSAPVDGDAAAVVSR